MDSTGSNNTSADIVEIDCGETVWSLAFGSSISYVKHNRSIHKPKILSKVNTRLNLNKVRLMLAVGLSSGKIKIYDMSDFKFLFVIFDHKDLVRDLKFTKDGSLLLASVSRDETIKLWNMYDDGNMYKTLKGHTGYVYACDWSPSSSLLCSVGSNRQAFVWNTETYTVAQTLRGHLHDVVTCEFSPDGMLLATGSYDTKGKSNFLT
jgi:WD repeat/SOCS box-containing protein 1